MGDNDCYHETTTDELAARIRDLEQQVAKLKAANKAKSKIIASLKGEEKKPEKKKKKEKHQGILAPLFNSAHDNELRAERKNVL